MPKVGPHEDDLGGIGELEDPAVPLPHQAMGVGLVEVVVVTQGADGDQAVHVVGL